MTLAWEPIFEQEIVEYRLYYGTTPGDYWSFVAVGNVSQATIRNLKAGTTYYIAATAVDAEGRESGFSNEVSFTTPAPRPLARIEPLEDGVKIHGHYISYVDIDIWMSVDSGEWEWVDWIMTGEDGSYAWIDRHVAGRSSVLYRLIPRF